MDLFKRSITDGKGKETEALRSIADDSLHLTEFDLVRIRTALESETLSESIESVTSAITGLLKERGWKSPGDLTTQGYYQAVPFRGRYKQI